MTENTRQNIECLEKVLETRARATQIAFATNNVSLYVAIQQGDDGAILGLLDRTILDAKSGKIKVEDEELRRWSDAREAIVVYIIMLDTIKATPLNFNQTTETFMKVLEILRNEMTEMPA